MGMYVGRVFQFTEPNIDYTLQNKIELYINKYNVPYLPFQCFLLITTPWCYVTDEHSNSYIQNSVLIHTLNYMKVL